MGLGEVQVVNKLANLNELGAEALMRFVEGKASTPEWTGPHATLQFSEQSQRSTVLREAVRGIEITCSLSLDTETRLWRAFDLAIQTNETSEYWGDLPGEIAFVIQSLFDKYSYWVVRDFRNRIDSLPEIHEQRAELAGKGEYRNVRIKQSWLQKQLGSARNYLSALRWILFRR